MLQTVKTEIVSHEGYIVARCSIYFSIFSIIVIISYSFSYKYVCNCSWNKCPVSRQNIPAPSDYQIVGPLLSTTQGKNTHVQQNAYQ